MRGDHVFSWRNNGGHTATRVQQGLQCFWIWQFEYAPGEVHQIHCSREEGYFCKSSNGFRKVADLPGFAVGIFVLAVNWREKYHRRDFSAWQPDKRSSVAPKFPGITAISLAEIATQKQTKEVKNGEYSIVSGSPELWLGDEKWRKMAMSEFYRKSVRAVAVDEAHVICHW